ncbi:MAG: Holliday junction resolvase RuvX [Patescibacteria group bacterium]
MKSFLAIDYGTKRIGLAYTQNNIIFTLPQLQNNKNLFSKIKKIISDYHIQKIYIGLSEGYVATQTLDFISRLRGQLSIPVDTVEEAVSTLEAESLYKKLGKKKKEHKKNIDSFSAAVILGRALGYN